jgi:SAM-dependent methyltransferase
MKRKFAFDVLVNTHQFYSVLQIGPGILDKEFFKNEGKKVTTIALDDTYGATPEIIGDYNTHEFEAKFDCIWASHVLEHQRNVGSFLDKMYRDLNEDGVYVVIVPPLKHKIVGGHLSLWNGGLLLYNMIMAGFDCSEAILIKKDYNIALIGKKKPTNFDYTSLTSSKGDIEKLSQFFPFNAVQSFNGDI